MTVYAAEYLLPTLHDETTLPVPVHKLVDPYCGPYRLPNAVPVPAADLRALTLDIQRLTGWSNRVMARVLRTTHPTVARLLQRGAEGVERNPDYRDRLRQVHAVVVRIAGLALGDPAQTAAMLHHAVDGRSAIDRLRDGDAEGAYLAAIDVLREHRHGQIVRGERRHSPGSLTYELHR